MMKLQQRQAPSVQRTSCDLAGIATYSYGKTVDNLVAEAADDAAQKGFGRLCTSIWGRPF